MKFYKFIILISVVIFLVGCNTNTQNAGSATPPVSKTSGSADSEFREMLQGKNRIEWQAAYDIKGKYGQQEFQSSTTQYFKGTKSRMDVLQGGLESRSYVIDGTSYFCTKTGKLSCSKLPSSKDVLAELNKMENDVNSGNIEYTVKSDGTKSIAGATAKCFLLSVPSKSTTLRYCFSKEGVMLYTLSQGSSGTTEMTAKTYSTSVSDSIFQLPAEASTLTIPTIPSTQKATVPEDPCKACESLAEESREDCFASCGSG